MKKLGGFSRPIRFGPKKPFLNVVELMNSLSRKMVILGAFTALVITVALVQGVYAAIYLPEHSSSDGDPSSGDGNLRQGMDEVSAGSFDQPKASPNWPEKSREEMLAPIEEISGIEVLLDVSESAKEHIPGAVAVSYEEFILGGDTLKSLPEIAAILSKAGISQDDSITIYGECMPCGGGPAPSTYVYWIMKSLGHKNVRIMDGTVDDWKASGRPTTNYTQTRPRTNYAPEFTSDLIATYDYIRYYSPQVVDARAKADFEYGSIPRSINIPYESVLDGDKLTDEASLERIFSVLTRDRPVVVFTQTGVKGSVVWFALKLMGFDAKLYSWRDWLENQDSNNYDSDR